ncbi:B3 domain-containing protein [Quillaja saponaria]|uniref:B3 domain-containing protein n=1 Tax=Quillaja saponaria TaxID=32244 RepID=A0AAD7PP38_QUISA|nr:B3 domain-containing protein [Quillaja saponaria]
MKYGADLSNLVFLKVPNGEEWKVKLTKEDEEVWFQNGWKEFAEHYSLAHGHLLVFRYEKTSYFHVHIFDVSALEIDYPDNDQELHVLDKEEFDQNEDPSVQILVDSDDDSVADILTESDDESVEILDLIPSCRKRKEKSSVECIQPCKIMKTSEGGKAKSNPTLPIKSPYIRHKGTQSEGTNVKEDFHSSKTKREYQEPKVLGSKQSLDGLKNDRALQSDRKFNSQYPFFTISLSPSYANGAKLNLPSRFARTYLKQNPGLSAATLQTHDGRTWHLKYRVHLYNKIPKVEFQNGWRSFAMDNNLEVGDVCVFEMINRRELTFRVSIFPVVKDCKVPEFLVMMGIQQKEHIPCMFAMEYFNFKEKERDVILRVSDGKAWPVTYMCRRKDNATTIIPEFSRGWKAFVRSNSLEAGDVCVFELVEETEITLQVGIFRANGNSESAFSPVHSCGNNQVQPKRSEILSKSICIDNDEFQKPSNNVAVQTSKLMQLTLGKNTSLLATHSSSSRNSDSLKAAIKFNSENPFFTATIRSYHMEKSCMSVPHGFAKSHLRLSGGSVVLQVGSRSWPIKLIYYSQLHACSLSAGWSLFARENELQIGDVCVFELIKGDDNVLKASIFRRIEW